MTSSAKILNQLYNWNKEFLQNGFGTIEFDFERAFN